MSVKHETSLGTTHAGSNETWRHWVSATRPKTLSIAVVPVLVGTALAWSDSQVLTVVPWLAALVAAILIQVGTNLHNDAADFERGIDDPSTRLGPPRATAEGWLAGAQVRRAAFASFALAFALGCYLATVGGWPIVVMGVAAIIAGVAYSAGPFPISHSGLSELFVLVFFGVVAVCGSYYLQNDGLSATAILAGLAVGAPAAAVLVVNNYRDLENDRRAGKHTLSVRLGRRATKIEFATLMMMPFVLLPALQSDRLHAGWWLLPWIALPVSFYLVWRFWKSLPGPALNGLLVATARFQLMFGLLLCMELVMGRLGPAT